MTPEWKKAYEAGLFTEFMEQRGPGHTVGSVKIYEKGFLDYKQDIQEAIDRLDYFHDPEALDTVSYTHLDVYKRQEKAWIRSRDSGRMQFRIPLL